MDLSGTAGPPGGRVREATERIADGIADTLALLRAGEPETPRYVDPTRPADLFRARRRSAPPLTVRPAPDRSPLR